ncbi:MAG: hypothetical protein H6936_11510 [Burkholderiales bacterium]|nr:hypothetical protein [Burkholderiales bacterium]
MRDISIIIIFIIFGVILYGLTIDNSPNLLTDIYDSASKIAPKFVLTILVFLALFLYTYFLWPNEIKNFQRFKIGSWIVIGLFLSVLFSALALIFTEYHKIFWLFATILLFTSIFKSKIKPASIQGWIERDSGRLNPVQRKILDNNEIWSEYRRLGFLKHRLLRATIMGLIFMNIDVFLIHLFPESLSPCRGNTCGLNDFVWIVSFAIVMFLIFLVLDAQRLCIHWIEKLRTKHPLLFDRKINDEDRMNLRYKIDGSENNEERSRLRLQFFQCYSVSNSILTARASRGALSSLENIIMLVAKRTRLIDELIYFPIIALMLMLFARIQYFDNLDFPLSSGIVYLVSISLLLYAGLKLRGEASKLKLAVINSAENNWLYHF